MHAIAFSPGNRDLRAFFAGIHGMQPPGPGGGWLTFALPPAEPAVHPADDSRHEPCLMYDDIQATAAGLRGNGPRCL
jgi:hypothetical protein